MLGKLLRNEFKTTYKTMLVIYIMTIVSTALGCILFGTNPPSNPSESVQNIMNVLSITFFLSYFLVVVMLVLITYILMCERFYKSMYSDQGYLTHTLPVTPLANLNVRLITSLVWLLLSGIILILSICSLEMAVDSVNILDVLHNLSYLELESFCMHNFGWHFPVALLIILLLIIAACLNALLLVFTALSLGQLASLHKIRAAIGFGVALGFLEQIVASTVMIHVVENAYVVSSDMTYEQIQALMIKSSQNTIWTIIAMFAGFAAIYYAVCAVIVKKHVNLE